jgi:transposase InsO family protein
MEVKALLNQIYRHGPAAYTGINALLAAARKVNKKINRDDVTKFLHGIRSYTMHKPATRRFRRLKTVATAIDSDWQVDLAVFQNVSEHNDGYNYLLVCVDCLSRFLFVEPLKTKRPSEVKKAFGTIFARSGRKPWRVFSDRGLEFVANEMRQFFEINDIRKFEVQTSPVIHCGMVERANRTIKSRLYKYFTDKKTQRWIDVIQQIVDDLNHSYHRMIKMRPVDVVLDNENDVRKAELRGHKRKARYSVGDTARIERSKHVFEKGYLNNFTEEIFKISRVEEDTDPVTYFLTDYSGDPITGRFYDEDLSHVIEDPDQTYDVEVVKTRTKGGKKQYLVRYIGYPSKFNAWVDNFA